MSSADAIEPEKTVRCNFFKHFNKGSGGLPDRDCKYKVNSPWELMQHIKKEHHKISITATKIFEELWERKNEQLNDPDFTEINAEKVSQKYDKNARSMATSDITSHKYADLATNDASDKKVHTNIINVIIAQDMVDADLSLNTTLQSLDGNAPLHDGNNKVKFAKKCATLKV